MTANEGVRGIWDLGHAGPRQTPSASAMDFFCWVFCVCVCVLVVSCMYPGEVRYVCGPASMPLINGPISASPCKLTTWKRSWSAIRHCIWVTVHQSIFLLQKRGFARLPPPIQVDLRSCFRVTTNMISGQTTTKRISVRLSHTTRDC